MTTDASIKAYFHDINDCIPLTRKREVELSALIKNGNIDARNELIEGSLLFVIDVAKKYQSKGLDIAELIGAGNEGLIIAAEKFDGTKGCKFITYAVWWIDESIRKALVSDCRTVARPGNVWDDLRVIAGNSNEHYANLERQPKRDELVEYCELSPGRVARALSAGSDDSSMDDPVDNDDNRTFMEFHVSPPVNHESKIDDERKLEDLNMRLNKLGQREKAIICQYYGLDGGGGATLADIGDRLGITRERIRQIRNKGLDKMREVFA